MKKILCTTIIAAISFFVLGCDNAGKPRVMFTNYYYGATINSASISSASTSSLDYGDSSDYMDAESGSFTLTYDVTVSGTNYTGSTTSTINLEDGYDYEITLNSSGWSYIGAKQ